MSTTPPASRPSGLRRGTNLGHVAEFNDAVILSYIRAAKTGTSRSELRSATGLAPQTVSDVCQRLLDQGLIAETGTSTKGFGRPRVTLELVPTSRYALGIHVDPATISYVLLDLAGNLIAHRSVAIPDPDDANVVIDQMAPTLESLLVESGVGREKVVGLGLAVPGPIDAEGGAMVDPPHLPGWHHERLRDRLRESTGFTAVVDKDVIAAIVAERWAGAISGASDAAFLYLGSGVGLGLITDDLVVRGRSSNAGDIGHLMVDDRGPLCELGHTGCLGTVCSPLFIVQEAVARGILPATANDANLSHAVRRLAELRARVDADAAGARDLVEEIARRLARGATIIANMHDTQRIVCGGPAWAPFADLYLPLLQGRVEQEFAMSSLHEIDVANSDLGADVAAIGAACLVLDERFATRPSSLLVV